jgi:hypothetical protein
MLEVQQEDGLACQQPVKATVDVVPLVRPKLTQLGGVCVDRERDSFESFHGNSFTTIGRL